MDFCGHESMTRHLLGTVLHLNASRISHNLKTFITYGNCDFTGLRQLFSDGIVYFRTNFTFFGTPNLPVKPKWRMHSDKRIFNCARHALASVGKNPQAHSPVNKSANERYSTLLFGFFFSGFWYRKRLGY